MLSYVDIIMLCRYISHWKLIGFRLFYLFSMNRSYCQPRAIDFFPKSAISCCFIYSFLYHKIGQYSPNEYTICSPGEGQGDH